VPASTNGRDAARCACVARTNEPAVAFSGMRCAQALSLPDCDPALAMQTTSSRSTQMTAKRKSGSTGLCDWVSLPRAIPTLSMPALPRCAVLRAQGKCGSRARAWIGFTRAWSASAADTGALHRHCASGVDLAGGDEEKAQMPETTIMLLILSWKMGAAKFGEVSKEVCAVRARTENAGPQTRAKPPRRAQRWCCSFVP